MELAIDRTRALMIEEDFDAILCFSPQSVLQFTHFAGLSKSHPWHPLIAIVTRSDDHNVALIVHAELWPLAKATPGIRRVYTYGDPTDENSKGATWQEALNSTLHGFGLFFDKKIGIEHDFLPLARYEEVKFTFRHTLLKDASALLNKCREVKDTYQIVDAFIAAELGHAFFRAAERALHAGRTEIEAFLTGNLAKTDLWKKKYEQIKISAPGSLSNGQADGFSFKMFPGSNKRSSHGDPTNHKLEDGEVISLNITTVANGMHAKLQRIVCMGKISEALAKMIVDIRQIHTKVLESLKPGVTCKTVYETSCNSKKEYGYGGDRPTDVGHGIGLSPREHLLLDGNTETELCKGMLFAIKSHLKTPGGRIQITDTVEITGDGCKLLVRGD
jgi:Xaa-Pro dipeptidase